jgi:hypothetical protein
LSRAVALPSTGRVTCCDADDDPLVVPLLCPAALAGATVMVLLVESAETTWTAICFELAVDDVLDVELVLDPAPVRVRSSCDVDDD